MPGKRLWRCLVWKQSMYVPLCDITLLTFLEESTLNQGDRSITCEQFIPSSIMPLKCGFMFEWKSFMQSHKNYNVCISQGYLPLSIIPFDNLQCGIIKTLALTSINLPVQTGFTLESYTFGTEWNSRQW